MAKAIVRPPTTPFSGRLQERRARGAATRPGASSTPKSGSSWLKRRSAAPPTTSTTASRSRCDATQRERKGMVTMVDEIYDRHYQAGRDELNAAIANAFGSLSRAIGNSFKVLNRIEYSAPWAAKPKRARG